MESNFTGADDLFAEDKGMPYLSDSLGFATMDPSPEDNNDFLETANFISHILTEENVEQRPFYDSHTLNRNPSTMLSPATYLFHPFNTLSFSVLKMKPPPAVATTATTIFQMKILVS